MKTKFLFRTVLYCMIVLFPLSIEAQAQRTTQRQTQQVQRPSGKGQTREIPQKRTSPATINQNRTYPKADAVKKSGTTSLSSSDKNKIPNRNGSNKIGNKSINIDNSKHNNINIHNQQNTIVRHNNLRPYNRPPYVYGGHRYYCYHPYMYHSYRPFIWGPAWHPWGFFIATLATTAIIVSVNNQQYHYDEGVYYLPSDGGYIVVAAPVGATITTLPPQSQTIVINETYNNYYYGGTYYEKSSNGYTVVPPTAGSVVENIPEGGSEVKIGSMTYVKYGGTYYQPIQQNGKNMYEVVNVEDGN